MCGPSEKEQQDSPRQDSAYHHQIHPRFRISVLVDPVESSHPIHDQRRKYSPTGIAVKPIIISSLQERLATFQNECSRNKTNDNISNRTFGQGPQNGHFDKIEIQDNRIYQQGRRKDVIQQYIKQFVHAFLLLFLPVKQKEQQRQYPCKCDTGRIGHKPPFPILPYLKNILDRIIDGDRKQPGNPGQQSGRKHRPKVTKPFPDKPIVIPSPVAHQIQQLHYYERHPIENRPEIFLLPEKRNKEQHRQIIGKTPARSFRHRIQCTGNQE